MALVFMDGFEGYTPNGNNMQGLILRKWATCSSNNPPTQTAAGRNSGQSLYNWTSVTSMPFPSQPTWIAGFGFQFTAHGGAGRFQLVDTSTVQVSLQVNGNGFFEVWNGNYSSLLGTGTTFMHLDTWYYVEIKITVNNTTGSAILKLNGNTEINLSNVNTRASSNNTANKVYFASQNSGFNGYFIDDFYLCDGTGSVNNDFLGDNKIETVFANGAGTHTQWTPSSGANYTTVNETAVNDDTNYVSTSTVGNIDTYNFTDLAAVTNNIRGIQFNLENRKDAAGSKSIAPVIRISSTDYVGSTIPVVDSYIDNLQIYETNPNTSAAWTVSDVNGAEFGVKLIS